MIMKSKFSYQISSLLRKGTNSTSHKRHCAGLPVNRGSTRPKVEGWFDTCLHGVGCAAKTCI